MGRDVQEVKNGSDGEIIGLECGRVVSDDFGGDVVRSAGDGLFMGILEF